MNILLVIKLALKIVDIVQDFLEDQNAGELVEDIKEIAPEVQAAFPRDPEKVAARQAARHERRTARQARKAARRGGL